MFRRGIVLAASVVALLAPSAAVAMERVVWDFRTGGDAGQWDIAGFANPSQTEEGVRLQAQEGGGRLLRLTELPHSVDAVRITFARAEPGQVMLLWHPRSAPMDQLVQLPLLLRGAEPEVIELDMGHYPDWDGRADILGLALPGDGDATLSSIELLSWSPLEKLWFGFLSFWHFDDFRVYSINFLWGPLLVFTPIGLSQLYSTQPPFGWSGDRVFYAALLLAAAFLAGRWYWRGRRERRRSLRAFALVFAALWLFYDVRMGLETMSYAWDDLTQYVFPPPGQKVFRNYENFYDVVEQSVPRLREEPRFMFLGPPGTPFLGIARYLAYPSTPLFESEDLSLARTWLVFRRPDVSIGSGSQLLVNGTAATPPGDVLQRFDATSFLFRIR